MVIYVVHDKAWPICPPHKHVKVDNILEKDKKREQEDLSIIRNKYA